MPNSHIIQLPAATLPVQGADEAATAQGASLVTTKTALSALPAFHFPVNYTPVNTTIAGNLAGIDAQIAAIGIQAGQVSIAAGTGGTTTLANPGAGVFAEIAVVAPFNSFSFGGMTVGGTPAKRLLPQGTGVFKLVASFTVSASVNQEYSFRFSDTIGTTIAESSMSAVVSTSPEVNLSIIWVANETVPLTDGYTLVATAIGGVASTISFSSYSITARQLA